MLLHLVVSQEDFDVLSAGGGGRERIRPPESTSSAHYGGLNAIFRSGILNTATCSSHSVLTHMTIIVASQPSLSAYYYHDGNY